MGAQLDGRLVMLGGGAVARCLLRLLLSPRARLVDPARLVVIDQQDLAGTIPEVLGAGATFRQLEVTDRNLQQVLAAHLGPGDVLVDLALDVDTLDEVDWCMRHGVRYLNASLERWATAAEPTLHQSLQDLGFAAAATWPSDGPTAVVDHGANPGLVSHFTKVALADLAGALLAEPDDRLRVPLGPARRDRLQAALCDRDWARLAEAGGVRVLHVSEHDTQVTTDGIHEPGVFACTWSPVGMWWEATAPAEFAWGTHERALPPQARLAGGGAGAAVLLATRGMHTLVRSWVPDGGPFVGMATCHEEAYTIADLLTQVTDGEVTSRPTVLFAYRPAAAVRASLRESEALYGYQLQPRQRVLADELASGMDQLGMLLGGDHLGWWTGSQLGIHECRKLVGPGQNATTLQVAASMLGALGWMLEHPRRGLCLPEDLDHQAVLRRARPYLGPCPSVPTDWTPTPPGRPLGPDTWQFLAFQVATEAAEALR
jgi:homospermidine synthase